jgi:large subunit ribosomal protein L15e
LYAFYIYLVILSDFMHRGVSELWKRPKENLGSLWRERLIRWRKERVITRVERPTRIDRARRLGYRAKQGFVVARVRVKRGKRKTPRPSGGRRPKRSGRFYPLGKSWQVVAEEKAARRFPNLEVLGSYYVGEDGKHLWYETILVDPDHPSVKKDMNIKWVAGPSSRGRAFRGLTSSGRKSRGLR